MQNKTKNSQRAGGGGGVHVWSRRAGCVWMAVLTGLRQQGMCCICGVRYNALPSVRAHAQRRWRRCVTYFLVRFQIHFQTVRLALRDIRGGGGGAQPKLFAHAAGIDAVAYALIAFVGAHVRSWLVYARAQGAARRRCRQWCTAAHRVCGGHQPHARRGGRRWRGWFGRCCRCWRGRCARSTPAAALVNARAPVASVGPHAAPHTTCSG